MADPIAPIPNQSAENFQSSATTTDNAIPGAPFAEVDGKSFATSEELGAYMAQKTGDTTHPDYKAPKTTEEKKPEGELATGAEKPTEEAPKPAADEKAPEGAPAWVQPDATDDSIKEALTKAGGFYAEPEFFPVQAEFQRTGDVSEATLKAYTEAKGIPLGMAREFVDLRKSQMTGAVADATAKAQAATDATVKSVYDAVGGEDGYKAMSVWATENLTPAEHAAYNKALDTDPTTAVMLAKGFNDRFKAEGNGTPARDLTAGGQQGNGAPQPAPAATGYASRAEQQKDMNDPKYAKDPAFRAMVQARTGKTTAF